jgi:DNA topoisomerase IB
VCRKYYIHPAVIESYLCGNLLEDFKAAASNGDTPPWLDPEESALLALLKKYDEEKLTAAAAA